jgi:WD40 repeat protein
LRRADDERSHSPPPPEIVSFDVVSQQTTVIARTGRCVCLIALSPDETRVAVILRSGIRIYSIASGNLIYIMRPSKSLQRCPVLFDIRQGHCDVSSYEYEAQDSVFWKLINLVDASMGTCIEITSALVFLAC